jgi:hypothetical protein
MEGAQKAARGPSAPAMTNKLRNPPGTENIKAGKSALSIISQLFSHEYLMRPGDRASLQQHHVSQFAWLTQSVLKIICVA